MVTIQKRPSETKRVIRSLQSAKDEIRKSKPKTVELIIRSAVSWAGLGGGYTGGLMQALVTGILAGENPAPPKV